ncbi:hypothetical protein V6N11_045988 [Hibiscus sabdariffa]|uniref:Uncharacterized protein n=1 Tax=Hibiscus sabdariffa TaxID=183260 RepID=A0ABR2Q367_9ROSI
MEAETPQLTEISQAVRSGDPENMVEINKVVAAADKKINEDDEPEEGKSVGLNCCRKSSRPRWLNYLNPNIKRGAFTADEINLIIRLHNLLVTFTTKVDPMEGPSLSVRKGAWTEEEDTLLKKCIEKYGEGTWHQVPSRAGLNRCRKSCRLRWLNYLNPNIKRGAFAADEVDLIIRLHNLLGNSQNHTPSNIRTDKAQPVSATPGDQYSEKATHQLSKTENPWKQKNALYQHNTPPIIKTGIPDTNIQSYQTLLANNCRWSLIAGRLPGRTANDVKNYWNNHLLMKKVNPSDKDSDPKSYLNPPVSNTKVIKPRPHVLSKNIFPVSSDENKGNNNTATVAATPASNSFISTDDNINNRCYFPNENEDIMWWENILMIEKEVDDQQRGSANDINLSVLGNQSVNEELGVVEEGNYGNLEELFRDAEFWNVLKP